MAERIIEFNTQVESVFDRFLGKVPVSDRAVEVINSEITGMVRGLCDAGRISIGPTNRRIALCGVPLTVLPFIPLALQLDHYGTYHVSQDGEDIGIVTYEGLPAQRYLDVVTVGLRTKFCPDIVAETCDMRFTLTGLEDEEELDETIGRGPVRKMQAKTGLPGDLLPETGLGQIPPGAKEKEGKGMNAEDIKNHRGS